MSLPFDLFVFDLDGTALGGYEPYRRFPDRFSALLDELSSLGARWAINTTWHPRLQAELVNASPVESRPVMMIGRTGLLRAWFADGGMETVEDEAWHRAVDAMGEEFLADFVPDFDRFCRDEFGPDVSLGHVEGEPLLRTVVLPTPARGRVLEALSGYLAQTGYAYLRTTSNPYAVAVLPRAMSKGEAVRKLQAELRVAPERTLVAGDERNDLPMFDPAIAALQVCPGNACQPVKELVRANRGVVGQEPYSDGVIEGVRRMMADARH